MRRANAAGLIVLSLLLVGGNLMAATCRLACGLSSLPATTTPPTADHRPTRPVARPIRPDDDCTAAPLPACLEKSTLLPDPLPPAAVSAVLTTAAPAPALPASPLGAAAVLPALQRLARIAPLRV